MVPRRFWQNALRKALEERSIVWVTGVRRVGKTVLCQSLRGFEYLDCELPRARRMLSDPESFFGGIRRLGVVLDEVHRLRNPSEVLKIAADHYPKMRVIATGSSSLQASRKFRDALTGRKRDLWLTPMMSADLEAFAPGDVDRRLLHGGLPPFFLHPNPPERDFQEWMDSYWAKDIVELFRIQKRASFQRFVELVLAQSGGLFDATRFARDCDVSRPTASSYLRALEATWAAHVVRPFSTRRATEIVAAPKVYGFDTGFVCALSGWTALREEDRGRLWEHYVLNEIHAQLQTRDIRFWRDKRGHEVDFVWAKRGRPPVAIECKWSSSRLNPAGIAAFRRRYPATPAWVVAQDVDRAYETKVGGEAISVLGLPQLVRRLSQPAL